MPPQSQSFDAAVSQRIENTVLISEQPGTDTKKAGKSSAYSVKLGEGAAVPFGDTTTKTLRFTHSTDSAMGLTVKAELGPIRPNQNGGFSRSLSTYNADGRQIDLVRFDFDQQGEFKQLRVLLDNGQQSNDQLNNVNYKGNSALKPAQAVKESGAQLLPVGSRSSTAPHVEEKVVQLLEAEIGKKYIPNTSPEGQEFGRSRPRLSRELGDVGKFMDAKVSVGTVDPVNSFLQQKNFSIRLDPIGPGEVAAAATLDITTKWKDAGTAAKIQLANGKFVPGAILPAGTLEQVYKVNQGEVFQLGTSDPTVKIYAAKVGNAARGDVGAYVDNLSNAVSRTSGSTPTGGLHIPEADFNRSGTLTSILGMRTSDGGDQITQAKFEHQFKLNKDGTSARAAAAAVSSKGLSFGPEAAYKIDGDYVAWVQVNGKTAFSVRISEKEMKETKIDFK